MSLRVLVSLKFPITSCKYLAPVYMEWGTPVYFFCFHALGNTKQKKPTQLDRGPPLHVNRVLVCYTAVFSVVTSVARRH